MSEIIKHDVRYIPLDQILADEEFNCRGHITVLDVSELAKSIVDHGLLQPVVVTTFGGTPARPYKLIAGFRRYMAHRMLAQKHDDYKVIAASVNTEIQSESDAMVLNIVENLNREGLNIAQEARTVAKLLEQKGMNRAKLAEKLKMSEGWIQIRTMLLNMPTEILDAASAGVILQKDIRPLYSQWTQAKKTYGEEDGRAKATVLKAVHDLKVIKERGDKKADIDKVILRQADQNIKKHRTRSEIFEMLEHIIDTLGAGLYTRALSWCAGEITTEEFEKELSRVAATRNKLYISITEKQS